jgi:hypothetical protein
MSIEASVVRVIFKCFELPGSVLMPAAFQPEMPAAMRFGIPPGEMLPLGLATRYFTLSYALYPAYLKKRPKQSFWVPRGAEVGKRKSLLSASFHLGPMRQAKFRVRCR